MIAHLIYQLNQYRAHGSRYTAGGIYSSANPPHSQVTPAVELLDNDGALLLDNDGVQLLDNV